MKSAAGQPPTAYSGAEQASSDLARHGLAPGTATPIVTGAAKVGLRRVVFVSRVLAHYRVEFFRRLHRRLASRGIGLTLIHGQEYPGEVPESVALGESWVHRIKNRYFGMLDGHVVWQPCWDNIKGADLVIVEQASRLLLNYALLTHRSGYGGKLAFWGHGKNLHATWRDRVSEKLKRMLIGKVDWWFVYTAATAKIVSAAGFAAERITVTQNAVDTESLAQQVAQQDPMEVAAIKALLGIDSDNVCIYCGSMYAEKRLEFLLRACEAIRHLVPDFHMLFIGTGPTQHLVEAAAARHPWIHYVGARFAAERVPYFCMSKATLMPSLVGLGVLDSLAAGLPLFATDLSGHGPEIAYLQDGVNGAITEYAVEAYAAAVSDYLSSEPFQSRLRAACWESARRFTLDAMVENFAEGIERCLATR